MLSTHHLAIGYSTRRLAADISFSLQPGEAIAVLGPNGCGKSTLFRTLLGLHPGLQGEVRLGGTRINDLSAAEIALNMAYVPQVTSGFFNFSVIEVVEMARMPHLAWYAPPGVIDRQIATDALAEFGMAKFAHRPFDALSGGEQQLVLIARALAAEAPIILLDEPTASLDFGNQFLILDEIIKLTARGISVLFTTHNPDHALRIAHRTMTISREGTIDCGLTKEILNNATLAALYGLKVQLIEGPNGLITAVGR